ncbi:VOC family protein [Ornithinibacter aureus]|mgnify:FL=1|uniref:VOC family protein n=1 Tax=Ornithinibacter aureus TaxID=622664 RepID=A0ABP8JRZ3_9MICO|nr:VOC family protein [Ornithinibacter aureus]KAF0834351.1 catechol 2,3-dioxygenase-like lactoylglutathione lyase family enzyme [Ornithinibacter aureus]
MPDRSGSQIDHLNIAIPDLTRARAFYDPLLASIGIQPVLDIPATATDAAMTGYGWPDTKPFFWLINSGAVGTNMHLAFTVDTRELVHAFYDTAAGLDAQLLHPPATHLEYHEHYYGAFVLDPHGINIEAVCHHDQAP